MTFLWRYQSREVGRSTRRATTKVLRIWTDLVVEVGALGAVGFVERERAEMRVLVGAGLWEVGRVMVRKYSSTLLVGRRAASCLRYGCGRCCW